MAARNELAVRARNVGLDPTTYANDSKLEQKILWLEKRGTTFAGALATGTLTSDATASADGDTTVVGGVTYTWKTALSEVAATSTLTSNNTTPTDGDYVQVGGVTYTFRTTLTNAGNAPYEVLINSSADGALANLKLAVNLTGTAGTNYGVGTAIHPTVTCGNLTSHTLPMTAKTLGTNGNNILTSAKSTASTLTWTGTNFSGGVNPIANQVLIGVSAAVQLDNLKDAINLGTIAGSMGTTYSTGTAIHPQVTATTNTNTQQVVQAIDYNVTNADIATTNPIDTGTHLAWGGTTLSGGVLKQIAVDTSTAAGSSGLSGDANV